MIFYGKPVAEAIEEEIKTRVQNFRPEIPKPFLAVILVGDDPASRLYTQKKKEKAESLGVGFRLYHFPADIEESNIIDLINCLNQNKNVSGIIIQLPLPEKFNTPKILAQIDKQKDVDGLNGGFAPATAGAILELLDYYNIGLKNKRIAVVGRGKLVGSPLEKILSEKNYDVIMADSKTEDLASVTLSADIIISGVGKPGLIKPEMVREDTVVVDAGTAESNGSTVGDIDPAVYQKAQSYSPVPGGVGPVTVAKLLKNVVEAAEKAVKI